MQAEGDLPPFGAKRKTGGAQRRSARNEVKEDWGYGLCARGAAPIRSSKRGGVAGEGTDPAEEGGG